MPEETTGRTRGEWKGSTRRWSKTDQIIENDAVEASPSVDGVFVGNSGVAIASQFRGKTHGRFDGGPGVASDVINENITGKAL